MVRATTGGFGTGSGRAGAIVALVLSLIGISLGGLALARFRHSPKAFGNAVLINLNYAQGVR